MERNRRSRKTRYASLGLSIPDLEDISLWYGITPNPQVLVDPASGNIDLNNAGPGVV